MEGVEGLQDYHDSVPAARQQPRISSSPEAPPLRCCCGRSECAYLQHNNAVLEGLERDVATAAQLGQVCRLSFFFFFFFSIISAHSVVRPSHASHML